MVHLTDQTTTKATKKKEKKTTSVSDEETFWYHSIPAGSSYGVGTPTSNRHPSSNQAGGSGNEEELHDEDTSTTSSVVGPSTVPCKKPAAIFYKVGEKTFKPNRRFLYDRYKNKEPLVKLENKTFDEEEYTKISTPRQDVLFKKGYFGKKRESSVEAVSQNSGETEGEEPMMDQLIITNGFVDERGHYLVNGNSYEIYDPYSNTVTVVVGPPPYTSGVTQPVLAAVSCQPVPLQPVDWFPPGSDWPSQGSAWTPSFPQNFISETINNQNQNCENETGFYSPDAQISNMYNQPPYFVQGYIYSESPPYDGTPIQSNNSNPTTKNLCSSDNDPENEMKKTRRKSMEESITTEKIENSEEKEKNEKPDSRSECPTTVKNNSESTASDSSWEGKLSKAVNFESQTKQQDQLITNCVALKLQPKEGKEVEKESHSTQTNLLEEKIKPTPLTLKVPEKESHSTQTLPEETIPNNEIDLATQKNNQKNQSNSNSATDTILSSPEKGENEFKRNWKTQHNKSKEYYNSLPKKNSEEPFKKIYQRRTNFIEERKYKIENFEKAESISLSSPLKISYAKKAMVGLENINDKNTKIVKCTSPTLNNKITKDLNNTSAQPVIYVSNQIEQTQTLTNNETNRRNYVKQVSTDRFNSYEEKKHMNGNIKNGFLKPRYDNNSSLNKHSNDRNNQKNFKYKEKKVQLKPLEVKFEKYSKMKEKCEEVVNDLKSQSEKSSTTSELSSPTELSSGQNTPPEKYIVKTMEQKIAKEINKSFEEKLNQNLTKNNLNSSEKEECKIEEQEEALQSAEIKEKEDQKLEGKKRKKNKAKAEVEKTKETLKSSKRKKKKAVESKDKSESDNFSDNLSFLPKFINQKPKDLFEPWSDLKNHPADLISEINQDLTDNCEILKSLGINEDKISFSKLPLHSDLLMMLPNFGWSRPKLRIEDIFAPTKHLQDDLFTRRNIISMKSTKPEEFFASVVDNPVTISEKAEKKKEGNKTGKTDQGKNLESQSNKLVQAKKLATSSPATKSTVSKKNLNLNKTGCKTNKTEVKNKVLKEEREEKKEGKEEEEKKIKDTNKLGIVEAVNEWLQEQGGSEKVISKNTVAAHIFDNLSKSEEDLSIIDATQQKDEELHQKNGISNPMHALSGSKEDSVSIADFRGNSECIRVANVINDGLIYVNKDFFFKKKNPFKNHIFRSSSWEEKLSDGSLKKHFKFLTDSASFCQDLISDVRNGLPVKNEYATEELCDPKQSVRKYYTLSPNNFKQSHQKNFKQVHDSDDSENEVFDALEYKFIKEKNFNKPNEKRQNSDGNGTVSISDSGVHSDLELSEDTLIDQQRQGSCKLQ